MKQPSLNKFLRTEARQLLNLRESFLVSFRDEAETEKTEDSDDPSDDKEAVGNPGWGSQKEILRLLSDLFKTSSSTKYFSLQSTSVELVI